MASSAPIVGMIDEVMSEIRELTGQEYRHHYAGENVETSTGFPVVAHPAANATDALRVTSRERELVDAREAAFSTAINAVASQPGNTLAPTPPPVDDLPPAVVGAAGCRSIPADRRCAVPAPGQGAHMCLTPPEHRARRT